MKKTSQLLPCHSFNFVFLVEVPLHSAEVVQLLATVNAVPRSSGTLASLAKQLRNLLQSVLPLLIRQAKLSTQSLPHSTLLASYTELPLAGLGLETYLQVRSEISQKLHLVLSQCQTPRFHIVRHSPNSLSTVQDTSIVIGPRHICDVIFAEEVRGVRFGSVAVVRRQKHVVNMYDDHSDEMSRKVTQAEEGMIQFERFP